MKRTFFVFLYSVVLVITYVIFWNILKIDNLIDGYNSFYDRVEHIQTHEKKLDKFIYFNSDLNHSNDLPIYDKELSLKGKHQIVTYIYSNMGYLKLLKQFRTNIEKINNKTVKNSLIIKDIFKKKRNIDKEINTLKGTLKDKPKGKLILFYDKVITHIDNINENDRNSYLSSFKDKTLKTKVNDIFTKMVSISKEYREYNSSKIAPIVKIVEEDLIILFFKYLKFYIYFVIILFIALLITLFVIIKNLKKIQKQLVHDDSSNLANYNSLVLDVNSLKNSIKAVIYIKVINLKKIFDAYGLRVGEEVRQKLIKHMTSYLKGIKIYALVDDTFIIVVKRRQNLDELLSTLDSFAKSLLTKRDFYLKVNIGVSKYDFKKQDSKCGMTLVYRARNALELLVNSYNMSSLQFYNDDVKLHRDSIRKDISLYKDIVDALENGHFVTVYQPIKDVKTGEIFRFEALIRLHDDGDELVLPSIFLDLMRDMNLINEITKITLRNVFETIDKYKNNKMIISVNIFYKDIENKYFMEYLKELLLQYKNFDKSLIIFELLESDSIKDYELIKDVIRKLRDMGFGIAMDDFGTGFSNFSNFLIFDIDFLKIDGSFVKNILTDYNSQRIVETMINFAQKLGIKTVAEFVHNKGVHDYLTSLGVDYLQGNYISEAVEDISTLIDVKS